MSGRVQGEYVREGDDRMFQRVKHLVTPMIPSLQDFEEVQERLGGMRECVRENDIGCKRQGGTFEGELEFYTLLRLLTDTMKLEETL
jgi:hypothetical protein